MEGLNREARPMGKMCSKDAWNQTFTHTFAMVPSQARWVTNWMLGSALQQLHPTSMLSRVETVVSDKDGQLCNSIQRALEIGGTMSRARHHLCCFHALNRNLSMHSTFRGLEALLSEKPREWAEWKGILSWLWTICRESETAWEASQRLHGRPASL